MRYALLTAALLTAAALPAGAQTLAMTSGANASSAMLVTSQQVLPQPDLRERRTLAMAAFERPQPLLHADALKARSANFEAPPLEPKAEWTSDEGLRMKRTKLVYKARF
jgi:hypothetical protein